MSDDESGLGNHSSEEGRGPTRYDGRVRDSAGTAGRPKLRWPLVSDPK